MGDLQSASVISTPHQRVAAALALLLTPAAAVGARALIRALNRVPNSAESFEQHWRWIALLGVCGVVILAALATCCWRSRDLLMRRAGRVSGRVLIAAIAAWIIPAPFSATRLIGEALFCALAAINLVVLLRATRMSFARAVRDRPAPLTAPISLIAATISVVVALLLAKLDALGWARAMD